MAPPTPIEREFRQNPGGTAATAVVRPQVGILGEAAAGGNTAGHRVVHGPQTETFIAFGISRRTTP